MSSFTQLYIVRNGVAKQIDDAVEWLRGGDDGFGLPDIEPISESGPNQDGSTDKGFRLKPRVINLALKGFPTDRGQAYWDFRQDWLKLFRPTNVPTILRVVSGSMTREILVKTVAGSKLPRKQGQGIVIEDGVQLLAHDPTWYDPGGVALSLSGGAGGSGMPVPLIVPMTVGSSGVNVTVAHPNTGTWRAYPLIRITGPITNPILTNTTTGKKLSLQGYTITAGSWIEIDTRYEAKTVVDQAGANQISKLTTDSDLASWALEADPEAPDGLNNLTWTGTSATAATKLDLTYFRRFIGI